jgi:hypothetical protein
MEGVLDLQYSIPNDGDGHLEILKIRKSKEIGVTWYG